MKFKDFEIRPTCFLGGHTDPKRWDVVKWYDHDPVEVTDLETGEKKISTHSCYSALYCMIKDGVIIDDYEVTEDGN